MKSVKIVMIIFVLCFVLSPNLAFAYGGGGGGGGAGSDSEVSSSGGGAVSWSSNPNGLDVMGSSIWHGRPENLREGPYQPGTAVEDAEQDLLDGFKGGEYTSEEVKENLQWAKKAGIHISNEAQKVLDGLSAKTGSAGGQSRTGKTSYSEPMFAAPGEYGFDLTTFAILTLAASTGQEGGGLSNKDAFGVLFLLSLGGMF